MTLNRGLLFWGLALITAGAVALAAQQGYLDRDALGGAWRLWPLVLIAIGLSIVLSRTPFAVVGTVVAALVVGAAGGIVIAAGPGCGGTDSDNANTARGEFGNAARVSLEFNCGTLEVGMSDDAEWSVVSGREGSGTAQVTADSDSLRVESDHDDSWWGGSRQDWSVLLPSETRYELDVSPNAADARLDLRGGDFASISLSPNAGSVAVDLTDAQVDELDLSLNAGSASVIIGQGLDMVASMSVNAGSIDVCVADGVALQVTVDENITFSHDLDESDLVQSGDTWSTPGFAEASDQVSIELDGNAASFSLNPDDGCDTAAND